MASIIFWWDFSYENQEERLKQAEKIWTKLCLSQSFYTVPKTKMSTPKHDTRITSAGKLILSAQRKGPDQFNTVQVRSSLIENFTGHKEKLENIEKYIRFSTTDSLLQLDIWQISYNTRSRSCGQDPSTQRPVFPNFYWLKNKVVLLKLSCILLSPSIVLIYCYLTNYHKT